MLLICIWGQIRRSFWSSVCRKAEHPWIPIYPECSSLGMKFKHAGSGPILSSRQGAGTAADADDGADDGLCFPVLVPQEGRAPRTLCASKLPKKSTRPLQHPRISAGKMGKTCLFARKRNRYGQAGCTTTVSPGQVWGCSPSYLSIWKVLILTQYKTSLFSEIQNGHTK